MPGRIPMPLDNLIETTLKIDQSPAQGKLTPHLNIQQPILIFLVDREIRLGGILKKFASSD